MFQAAQSGSKIRSGAFKTSLGAFALAFVSIALESTAFAPTAWAAEAVNQPTALLAASANYFTYKSKLAASNDTGISQNYTFGIYAGDDRQIGALLRGSMYTAKFALNSSSIAYNSQDFIFNYRMGWVYAGASVGTSTTKFVDATDTQMDAFSTTVGGNFGILVGISRQSTFHLDIQAASALKTKEAEQKTVKVGLRIDADTGVSFTVYKRNLDLLLGMRVSSQTLTANGTGGAELITAPSVGFQFGF